MEEVQNLKNTSQNPLFKRANSSPQKAEPDPKKSKIMQQVGRPDQSRS